MVSGENVNKNLFAEALQGDWTGTSSPPVNDLENNEDLSLEEENWRDLHWSIDVLAGRGDVSDNRLAAVGVLYIFSSVGSTPALRSAATSALCEHIKRCES